MGECPGVKRVDGVTDRAFGGSTLVLSELAMNLSHTFCGECYRGIVSAGSAGGHRSKQRKVLLDILGGVKWTLSDRWSTASHVTSTLVVLAEDRYKQKSVKDIVHWLKEHRGVDMNA